MNKPYSVSVRITEPGGNILWVRRSASEPKRAGQYEYPGGHVEPGERAREAALREVREEIGRKIPEYELRVLKRIPQDKGDHIIFEYRARKAFYPKLSIEHDHFIWSPTRPAPALRRPKPKRIVRVRRNPADLLRENGLFSYFKGKDTSGMTTEEKARQAAVGTGTTLAVKGASRAISKKLAAKTGAKVAAKGASKLVPFVGQAIMVVDAAPEAVAVLKEGVQISKQTGRDFRAAKGVRKKAKAIAKGFGRTALHQVKTPFRIGAAAFVGSDVVKMGREAATEKLMAKQNGPGTFVFQRGGKVMSKIGAKVAAKGGIASLAKGATIGVLAVTGLAKTAAREGMEVKEIIQGKRKNPAAIQANIAEINQLLANMPDSWETMLERNRSKLRAAGASSSQLPPKRPNAHNVLLALNLNNRGEVSSEAAAGQEQPGGNPVPDDVRAAAMQGIRESHANDYGGYDFIGVARAIQLAISPSISDAALNRMRMYFDRKTKQDRLSDQYVNKSGKRYWSWLNWGGDPGARWSESKRFAELVKENPMLPVRRNFFFGKADPEAMDAMQRAALIKQRTAELGNLYADRIIVRAPAKPGLFSGKFGPAYYMVNGFSARGLEDTSEYGMPITYSELASPSYLLHAFEAFSKNASAKVALLDAYTGAVRKFDSINDYNAAVKAANGDWKALMAKNNRGRGRKNPYYVTTGGQAVPHGAGEDPRTWQASASHMQRHETEGRAYKIVGPDLEGRWYVVDKRTGRPMLHPVSGNTMYGMSLEGAQEVVKKLARRTNPNLAAYIAEGRGLRVRDLIPPTVKPASTKKKGGKKAKRNPSPGITMEEWFADVADSDWANWDLNRAGIMHYSGRGIPTYQSIVKK